MPGGTSADATARRRSRIPLRQVVMATIIALVTIVVIWWLAVPAGPVVCPAIMPPPTNCLPSHREGTAIVLTVVTAAIYVTTVVIALTLGRRRPAIASVGVVVLIVALLVAWPLIGLLPGFAVSPA